MALVDFLTANPVVIKETDKIKDQIRDEAGKGAKEAVLPLILLCLGVSTLAIVIALARK